MFFILLFYITIYYAFRLSLLNDTSLATNSSCFLLFTSTSTQHQRGKKIVLSQCLVFIWKNRKKKKLALKWKPAHRRDSLAHLSGLMNRKKHNPRFLFSTINQLVNPLPGPTHPSHPPHHLWLKIILLARSIVCGPNFPWLVHPPAHSAVLFYSLISLPFPCRSF